MPDRIVELDGVQHHFPADATDAEISSALQAIPHSNVGQLPSVKRGWIDTATNLLPAAAGAVGGIVGGIGGTVLGYGVGGVPGAVGGAALGGAAGEAAKQLVNRVRGLPAPATPGEAAAQIATQGAVQGAAEGVGSAIGGIARVVAPRVMQAAVKPTLSMLKDVVKGAEVPHVVQALLDEGINVTPAGYQKLHALLNTTTAERNAMISGATQAGAPGVRPLAVAGRLSDTAKQFGAQVNPTADLEAISRAGQDFLEAHGGADIPLEQANALKQGTYQMLKKKYGQLGSADIEAQKTLARGLKEEIEKQVPGVDDANSRIASLMAASQAVGRRVAVASNRDPVGFAWVAHNPATFIAALLDRSPAVKSMLARGLYQSAGIVTKVSPQLIRAGMVALASEGADSSSDPGSR